MSEAVEAQAAKPITGARAVWVLLALVAGLVIGALAEIGRAHV